MTTTAEASELKPILKWAGGKRWLLSKLRELKQSYPDHRLVDLCCGGLAVSLGLQPCKVLANDINPHLINFYRYVQSGAPVCVDFKYDKDTYYVYRSRFNVLATHPEHRFSNEAAQLFYYLNRSGFNGLCRFNSKGEFNVPIGRYKSVNYKESFTEYSKLLQSWIFSNSDFEAVRTTEQDFIYADPPYDTPFTKYSQEDFNWEDQVRLANWLARRPGVVVASNQATERIVELYQSLGFSIELLDAPRRINRTGDRTPAKEILATKLQ